MTGARARRAGLSGALAAVGIIAGLISWRMENPLKQTVGPGYVPVVVSVCLTVLALWQTVAAYRAPIAASPRADDSFGSNRYEAFQLSWPAAAALIGGAVWIWSVLGYVAGIVCAVLGVMLVDRKVKPFWAFAFALLLSLSLWVLFDRTLKIDLG